MSYIHASFRDEHIWGTMGPAAAMRLIRLIIIGPTGNTTDGAASCRDQRTGTVNLSVKTVQKKGHVKLS